MSEHTLQPWKLFEWIGGRWVVVGRYATLEEADRAAEARTGCHRIGGA